MFPFPSRNLTLTSPLSVEAAAAALRVVLGTPPPSTFREIVLRRKLPYEFDGDVTDACFAIIGNFDGNNADMPIVRGTFRASATGCTIPIQMRPARTSTALAAFVLQRAGGRIFPWVCIVVTLMVVHVASWIDVVKADDFFNKTLRARIGSPV